VQQVEFSGPVPSKFVQDAGTSEAIELVSALPKKAFNISIAQRRRRPIVHPARRANASEVNSDDPQVLSSGVDPLGRLLCRHPAKQGTFAVRSMQACLSSLDGVTPTCLRSAYGLDNDTAAAVGRTDGGQAFIVNRPFAPSDLAKFQSEYARLRPEGSIWIWTLGSPLPHLYREWARPLCALGTGSCQTR
jgi:hypothetical protein